MSNSAIMSNIRNNIKQPMTLYELTDRQRVFLKNVNTYIYKNLPVDGKYDVSWLHDSHLKEMHVDSLRTIIFKILENDEYDGYNRKNINLIRHLVKGKIHPFDKWDEFKKDPAYIIIRPNKFVK